MIIKENNWGDWGLMFNNINENNRDLLFNSQYGNAGNVVNLANIRSNIQRGAYSSNPYVDKTEISQNAMQMFQRDLDIKKFTKIASENPEDISHLERMRELFDSGVVDPFEEDILGELATNSKLWDDLNA